MNLEGAFSKYNSGAKILSAVSDRRARYVIGMVEIQNSPAVKVSIYCNTYKI